MFEVAAVSLAVGLLIGWSGVAGFLLPLFFAGYMGLPVVSALAVSFFDFAISGVLGSWNYARKGNLDLRTSLVLGTGSLVGALAGVGLGLLIPARTTKLLLYLVVLLSGLSILFRRDREGGEGKTRSPLLDRPLFVAGLGAVTGAICSISGAGGPILVMPLLVVLGMRVHTAIGVALLDSVFIALPAVVGYLLRCDLPALLPLLLLSGAFHGLGVVVGSRSAHRIRQRPLRVSVALFSVVLGGAMLFIL